MKQIQNKQIELAILNPYNSVVKCNPRVLDKLTSLDTPLLMGIKNTNVIPKEMILKLESKGFIFHTIDKMSLGGRAIDVFLKNPITGRNMTGSSSGTAINVFTYINDIGIGTDGGGSVLAPAMSLNLFSFISPLIEFETVIKFQKKSTDGISFSPSIGFIARDLDVLESAINNYIEIKNESLMTTISLSKNMKEVFTKFENKHKVIENTYPKYYEERKVLIDYLNKTLKEVDVLITKEGPIDLLGYGDSIIGLYDNDSFEIQKNGNKGFLKVVNMVNATAITIPTNELSTGYLLICESNTDKINKMLNLAKELVVSKNLVSERYYKNIDMYFSEVKL